MSEDPKHEHVERADSQFTCPRCGSHFFGTYDKNTLALFSAIQNGEAMRVHRSEMWGSCSGTVENGSCDFVWKRSSEEDRKYFTEVPCGNYPETKKEATMSDRHSGYIVVLETNMRDDDAQPTLDAIRQIRGVIDVRPIVADPQGAIAETRVRNELRERLLSVTMNG